ncbi:hypothetical protein F183_A32180 [Bryobacterales bacterium F-183]|nr:hypothetical protein F183_A32180 [Bryobacterales bacterium F-183]
MDSDQYRRACDLFERLKDLPDQQAQSALATVAGDDSELRETVRRLLEADRHASGDQFLKNGAIEEAAAMLAQQVSGPLSPGDLVGSYRIERNLGEGGMGAVYLAEDTRLNRRVALKILHRLYPGGNEEREQRFQQEVRAVALLNHPHIVALFDAGQWRDHQYIAMEYVEGQTVRDYLQTRSGDIDPKTILDWVSQTASALGAAHEAGIVHRDIKPENIMVRKDGFVKVLDFGLAKLREPSATQDAAVSVFRSQVGRLAGTIRYLSPEQVAGKRVDGRSDLFSLGVVAYELATKQRPFDGPTEGVIFDAILNHTPPPPSQVKPSLGPMLDTLIMQALEKDVDLRFQTAADLRSSCKRLGRESSSSSSGAGTVVLPFGWRRRLPSLRTIATGAGLLALGAVASMLWMRGRAMGDDPELLQPISYERITNLTGEEVGISISPDGKQVLYASRAAGQWDIYLQRIGGNAAINLTERFPDDAMQPAMSPDGSRIVFRSEQDGGGLFLMEATGENPRRLTRRGYWPAWSPDNRHVAYSELTFTTPSARFGPVKRMHIVDTSDGTERELASGDAIQPAWSPSGTRIAFWALSAGGQRDIVTIAASGKAEPIHVTNDSAIDWNPIWSPSGRYLYFLSDRSGSMNIWRVPIDESTGKTRGEPQPVTVPAHYVGGMHFSAASNSLVYSRAVRQITLNSVPFDLSRKAVTGSPHPIASNTDVIANFTFSPDGTKIAYDTISDSLENLWVMNTDGSGQRRLTSGKSKDRVPMWSPNGDEIAFFSDRAGIYDGWTIHSDGSGLRRLTALGKVGIQRPVWSADGTQLIYMRNSEPSILVDPRSPKLQTNPPLAPGLEKSPLVWLHDWRWRYAAGTTYARPQKVVLYEPGNLTELDVAGRLAVWPREQSNADQRYMIIVQESEILLYDRVQKQETPLLSVAPNAVQCIASPPGGGSIFYSEVKRDGDLWLARFR